MNTKKLPRKADFASQSDLQMTAAVVADGEESSPPTFSIRAYNGGALNHPKFPYPVVVDLQTLNAGKSRPALLDHSTEKRVGHTTDIRNEFTHLNISGVVSATGDAAKEVVEAARNGFPWQASIGVYFSRPLELVKAGKTVELNGKSFKGPVLVARKAIFREITFTALGVDDDTSAQIAASEREGDAKMDPKFQEWLQASHLDAETLTQEALSSLEASWKQITAKPVATPEANDIAGAGKQKLDDDLQAAADNREYVAKVTKICASYDNPEIEVGNNKVDLAAHAIREGWSEAEVELKALRNSKEALPLPSAHFKESESNSIKSIEASLMLRQCSNDQKYVGQFFDEKTMENAMSPRYRSVGLQYLVHESILAAGGSVHPGVSGDELIRCYRETCLQAASGPSSVSLPNILSNLANKSSIQSYLEVPTTWRQFCNVRSMSDFKIHTGVRLTAAGTFEQVGKDGEIKAGDLNEDAYTNQLSTFGRRYFFNREDVINDDLSKLDGIRQLLGRQAALKLEEEVFTLLMSTADSFFAGGNNNLVTSNALSFAGLAAAEQALLDQQDNAGKPIALRATKILVPTSLGTLGRRFFSSGSLNETTTDDTPSGESNVFAGRFDPIVSPYLNSAGMANQSATTWYMFGDPKDVGSHEVGFLNGVETPTVESQEAPFQVLGFEFRGYFDFGVARGDHRGAVKCTA